MRLNKYIAQNSEFSRRKVDELITRKLVFVNGKLATLGMDVTDKDEIKLNNVKIKRSDNLVYYALNKPAGVVSTVSDEQDRSKVTDFVPDSPIVYPAGRLDLNSEGLIILTNDGEFTNQLTHPSNLHEKEYLVKCIIQKSKFKPTDHNLNFISKQMLKGIKIDGKKMIADKVDISAINDSTIKIQIVIHTGYNRQVRKMCDKMDLEVVKLKRTRIGKLNLEKLDLRAGEYKVVNKEDIL
jgi:23S rRNA pseudouridine2605 synthase